MLQPFMRNDCYIQSQAILGLDCEPIKQFLGDKSSSVACCQVVETVVSIRVGTERDLVPFVECSQVDVHIRVMENYSILKCIHRAVFASCYSRNNKRHLAHSGRVGKVLRANEVNRYMLLYLASISHAL